MSSSKDLPEMASDEIRRLGGVYKGVSERTHRTFPRLQAYLSMMLDGELQEYEYNRKLADELCDQFYELRVMKISRRQRSHYIAFLKMGSLGRLAMDDHLKLEFKNGSVLSTTIIHRAPFAPFGHSTLCTPLSHSSDPKSLSGLYLTQPFVEVVDSGKIPKNDHALRNALTKSRPTLVKISPSESTKSFGRIVNSFVKMRQRFNQSPRDRHTEKIVDSLLLTNLNKLAHHSIFDTIADQTVLRKYFHNQSFDETQLKAVEGLFSQQGVIGLIQGPPGAGKTFLIMKMMGAFVKFPKSTPEGPRRHQIMIVSTTNALTSATARKSQEFLNAEMPQYKAYVTRVHAPHTEESLFYDQVDVHAATSDSKSTIDTSLEILPSVLDNLGLDDLTEFGNRSPGANQSRGIIDTRLEDIEFSLAMRMLQVAGIVESDISEPNRFKRFRELLQIRRREKKWSPDLSLELENTFEKLRDAALKKSTVIVLTLSQAADPIVTTNCQPDHIFIDEASRPREPELMAVLAWYNCSITMVGDHLQTPPSVKSGTENTRFSQLQMSHFERAVQAGLPYTMLATQHRSDPAISKITSDIWYNSSIINAPEVENRPDSKLAKEFNLTCSRRKGPSIENDKPVRWINVTEAREAENAGPSKFSPIHFTLSSTALSGC